MPRRRQLIFGYWYSYAKTLDKSEGSHRVRNIQTAVICCQYLHPKMLLLSIHSQTESD